MTEETLRDDERFAKFAAFGCRPEDLSQSVFYNAPHNRVDVLLERADRPVAGHKVSLEFCFEPGFPVKEYSQASFRVTQEYLHGAGKGKKPSTL
jgi:hypothetical protein